MLGVPPAQILAKTIGFTTFAKNKLLWLLNGGSPKHPAAATALFFSPTLIKPMKYQHLCLQNQAFAYKADPQIKKLRIQPRQFPQKLDFFFLEKVYQKMKFWSSPPRNSEQNYMVYPI